MLGFLASATQAAPLPPEYIGYGTGGVGIVAFLMSIYGPALRAKLPGATTGAPSGPMREGDSEKLNEVHKVVTTQDGEHYLALFPRGEIRTQHDEQNERIDKMIETQEKIADSLVEISKTQLETATILRMTRTQ